MATFEDFLSEGKKLQIKRKYTENHPAQTVGKTASVRNAVLQAIADGVVTREEFNKILSELSTSANQWASRNRKYFNVSEDGVKLSKWGRRILAELDETPKATEVNEKIKVTKDKFPYIEFKDGGKKYEVEFDQGDIIDDHDNEGKDWYYVGVDQFGDEWEIDVYTDSRDEPEDWFYDTIKRVDESKVNEAKIRVHSWFGQRKEFKEWLKKHKVEIESAEGEDGKDTIELVLTGKTKDLKKILKSDHKFGWDDKQMWAYIEESKVNEAKAWDELNNRAEDIYGEFGFATLDPNDMSRHIDMKKADKLAKKMFGEFGFTSLSEEDMEKLINSNPKLVKESVVTEAKFVKEFDKAVLDAETEKDVLKVYPKAEFYVGKSSHFFGELEPNLFFKAYYAKYYKEDYGKKIKGDFKITTIYSEKGSRYVNLYVHESAVVEKDDVATHLDNLEDVVGKARDFFAIGKELDKSGYKKKYFYSDTMAPSYTIEVDGFRFAIINKRYVDKGDREVGDIAIGLLENMDTNMKNEITLFESFADFVGANFLNEAINSAILRSVLSNGREGKQGKKNLSQLAKGFYGLSKVALDKIEDEDFIVSNDVSKVFKNYGGSSHVLFFISDNEKENPYYDHDNGSWNDYKVVPGGGIVLAAMSGDRQFYVNEWSRWSGGRTWSKEKKGGEGQIGINHKYRGWGASGLSNGKRVAEMSDRVIVINLELIRQKYSTDQLRNARAEAKAGATAFKSDKEFKDGNMARYHKILADKAASLPLDKMVQDAIDVLAKQISDGLAKGEKTQYQEIKIGESPKGREVKARDASQHMSNILDDYARYVDYIRQAEESEARYGERESYYERESKNYAKRVKEKIAKIEKFDYAW